MISKLYNATSNVPTGLLVSSSGNIPEIRSVNAVRGIYYVRQRERERERERVGEREREMESQSSPAMRRYAGYYYDCLIEHWDVSLPLNKLLLLLLLPHPILRTLR